MIRESVYTWLIEWMVPAMEAEYKSEYGKTSSGESTKDGGKLRSWKGKYDKQVMQYRVDRLRTIVRRLVCGDKVNRFLCDGSRGVIYTYNGVCFTRIEEAGMFLKELFKRVFTELDLGEKYNDEYPAKMIADSCLDTLGSSDRYLYKPNRRYIAFNDAVYDIEQHKVVKAQPAQCPAIVIGLDYMSKEDAYKAGAEKYGAMDNPCRLWETKVANPPKGEGILPNRDARLAFQQWCGTLLSDREKFKNEYVLFLVGPGANGKSVIANTVVSVFGKENFSCFSFRQLFKDNDSAANIAELRGKVANFIDDMEGKEISGGDFKRAASGGIFQGRSKYSRQIVKVPFPPLMCCANSVPDTDDDSYGGQRRRLVVHTTTKSFVGEERDTQLTYKLTRPEALMYIFHWIVEGYRMFAKNKGDIVIGEELEHAQALIVEQSNSMRRWWFNEGYVAIKEDEKERRNYLLDLYAEYEAYAAAEGSEHKFSSKELSAMLTAKGCFKGRDQNRTFFCLKKSTTEV